MSYTQLTKEARYQIFVLVKAGQTQTQIAMNIGCHKSTVSRELTRNRTKTGYWPGHAQLAAQRRRRQSHQPRISPATWHTVECLLAQDWSPQQITGRLRLERQPSVSPELIYLHIYADQRRGGTLHQHLRSQKKQRRRHRGYQRRGQIPNRVSIEERPAIVDRKSRIGDWEGDLLVGAQRQSALFTATERKSKLALLCKLANKSAAELRDQSIELFTPFAKRVFTITLDNGKEFCEHEAIAKALRARIYFAHPYASWERGLNENTNGLVRQYFPKGSDLAKVTEAEVQRVAALLNNRPRKTLGYRTPNEIFFKQHELLTSASAPTKPIHGP
jgi:transposase, IS30 family